ncbi:HAD family hydrolase [Celerinatantimonas yamalensis]|uniref:Beta-phosphoglucomutase family hydrolase n=1 Tax=Celerinatantimonas yamalensis TaxID=559956 RepID=A0ABW9G7D0_9GAMM
MLDLSRYQAIIFDMDGTLIDSMPMHLQAWQHAAQQYQFQFDEAWLNSLGGMPSIKIIDLINQHQSLHLDPILVSQAKAHYFTQVRHQCKVIPTTMAIVQYYHGKLKMAIGTGSQRHNAEALLTTNQIRHYFDVVVSANDVACHKPHPDTFLLAAQKMAVTPNQCVVFEDTELGFEAARKAQMDVVQVKSDGQLDAHFSCA